ncbi:phage tail protein [Amorphus orientalis]|uniref:Uncharacterized protein n=1 Tax=Amorphus orientalis TaxID=649198 RepID=A0AAE3VMV5_9HYPH|nr:phage tail protein [Amorphus orientalis]MDQ0314838.1 hypothetical protein [Amorphus orientalis]
MLSVRWSNIDGLVRYERALKVLGDKRMRAVENRVVNRTGDAARTQVRRQLPKQTGLKRKVIVEAVRVSRSDPSTLTYTMTAQGGEVALKFFGARETRRGVSAAPFGQRKIFEGAFMKAGWVWSKRVIKPNWNGQVFKRTGGTTRTGMDEFEKQKSGVFIPKEMVRGATKSAFERTVSSVMPRRFEHEIKRATGGAFS